MGRSVFLRGGFLFGDKRTPNGELWGVKTREKKAGLFSYAEITGNFPPLKLIHNIIYYIYIRAKVYYL